MYKFKVLMNRDPKGGFLGYYDGDPTLDPIFGNYNLAHFYVRQQLIPCGQPINYEQDDKAARMFGVEIEC